MSYPIIAILDNETWEHLSVEEISEKDKKQLVKDVRLLLNELEA